MKFILITLFVMSNGDIHTSEFDRYDALDECMIHREYVVATQGRPIINYQAICVIWNGK